MRMMVRMQISASVAGRGKHGEVFAKRNAGAHWHVQLNSRIVVQQRVDRVASLQLKLPLLLFFFVISTIAPTTATAQNARADLPACHTWVRGMAASASF